MPTTSASPDRRDAVWRCMRAALISCVLLGPGEVSAESVAATAEAAALGPSSLTAALLPGAGPGCELVPDAPRAVAKVIDGETLQLQDGTEVRLIGALTPRAFDAGVAGADWPAEREARSALEATVSGRAVVTATVGRKFDRYGRLLAHVFLLRDDGPVWLQAALVAAGQARAYVLPESTACAEPLIAQEAAARAASAGLWRNPAYAVRDASRTGELSKLRNSYQIVDGIVTGIADVRGHVYVNFGDDWRTDFTAGVATARVDRQWLDEVRALAGKRVRVRGWIERQNGPYIAVVDRSQLQVLDDTTVPAAAAEPSPEAGPVLSVAEPPPTTRRKRRGSRGAAAASPSNETPLQSPAEPVAGQ